MRTEFTRVTIDPSFLETIGPTKGYLTDGQINEFSIRDDERQLRKQFGGWMKIVHGTIFIFFLLPYAWFIGRKIFEGHILPLFPHVTMSPQKDSLAFAFWKHILTGNQTAPDTLTWGDINRLSFSAFLFFVVYNIVRVILLTKNLSLEHHAHVYGFSSLFSFREKLWNLTVPDKKWWKFNLKHLNILLWPVNALAPSYSLLMWLMAWFTFLAFFFGLWNFWNFLCIQVPE